MYDVAGKLGLNLSNQTYIYLMNLIPNNEQKDFFKKRLNKVAWYLINSGCQESSIQ